VASVIRAACVMWISGYLLLATPSGALAQSADELARQTQNPVASLVSLPFQGNWDAGIGPREATGMTFNIQPVVPFSLTRDVNVILRVVMPLVSQPTDQGTRVNGLSDTVATLFLSPAQSGKLIWGAGPVFMLPTATNNALGSEKIGLGPSIVALAQPGKWTVGMLWNQVWSVDGAIDRPEVNRGFFQPFANYNLGDGIALGANMEATANWKDDEVWSAFLHFTASKVTTLGKQPINLQIGAGPALASPSGADWRLRMQLNFLFPR
jgi:hypothetical protein